MSRFIWMYLDCVRLELAARWLQPRDNELFEVHRREGPSSDCLRSGNHIWAALAYLSSLFVAGCEGLLVLCLSGVES